MAEQTPSKIKAFANIIGVGLFLVLSWIVLAVVIVFGALIDVLLFDRFHLLAASLTSAEQARWLWAGGLGFSLVCYGLGVYRAAQWFALVPHLRERERARATPRSAYQAAASAPPEHEIPKTRPSPQEIRERGMPRG